MAGNGREEKVNYSILDPQTGDKYLIECNSKEVATYNNNYLKAFQKVNELKRLGQKPIHYGKGRGKTKKVASPKATKEQLKKRPATRFKPEMNSTVVSDSTDESIRSPAHKKGRLLPDCSPIPLLKKPISQRQLPFNLNNTMERLNFNKDEEEGEPTKNATEKPNEAVDGVTEQSDSDDHGSEATSKAKDGAKVDTPDPIPNESWAEIYNNTTNLNLNENDVELYEGVPTCRVKVENLPVNFNPNDLIYEFKKTLWKRTCIKKPLNPIVGCEALGLHEATVIFDSVESATIAASLGFIEFLDDEVVLSHVLEMKENISGVPTCNVKVEKLPDNFNPNDLIYEFKKTLWKRTCIKKPLNPIVGCEALGLHEATVIFDSVESATIAASLELIEYLDDEVVLSPVLEMKDKTPSQISEKRLTRNLSNSSISSEEEDSNIVALKNSEYVKVTNLPLQTDKVHFKQWILDKMLSAGFIKPGHDCVEVAGDISEQTLLLKFSTCEEANLSCLLAEMRYMSSHLKCVKYNRDNDEELEGSSNVEYVPLNSDSGKQKFFTLLVKYRDSFPKSGSHDAVLEDLRRKLLLNGVQSTLPELRGFRQNLMRYHTARKRDNKTDHPLHLPCQVIFDGANKDLLFGTDYDINGVKDNEGSEGDNSFDAALRDFSTIATWSTDSSKALVEVLIDNKDDYHKPVRKSHFWRDISLQLYRDSKYSYKDYQCQNRYEKFLKPMVKSYNDMDHSGAVAPWRLIPDEGTRELMKLLFELEGTSVTLNPKLTLASGFKNVEKRAEMTNSVSERRGLSRPTVLRPAKEQKKSLAERKVAALEKKADAMLIMAKSRHQTTINSDDDD